MVTVAVILKLLAPWKESYDTPKQQLKNRDITLQTNVLIVKDMVFPVVIYRCDRWTIMKVECQRIDTFELWCWRRLFESPLDNKEIKPVNPKGNQPWIFIGKINAKTPILWAPDTKNQLIGKDPDARKDWRQKDKRAEEDEMVGWHHWFNGHEFEQILEDCEGQGSLVCCSPWGHKDSDMS